MCRLPDKSYEDTRPKRRLVVVAGLCLAFTAGCRSFDGHYSSAPVEASLCAPAASNIVCTAQGAIRGVAEGETLAFKGIPYAQPPVGPLRWRPPEQPGTWQGVRDGSKFGSICPQIRNKEIVGAEDCLTLNIWRPREKPDRLLPVMVWLSGGGNHWLSGQGSHLFGGVEYNGQKLAPEGVVFVTFNNRLGVLGFLAHSALDAERPEKISGNYGSLDQVAMLRWLQRNITAFGGDPKRVFVFGTSAGGGNICALIASPLTRGLIHGAAMQSSVPIGCEIQTLADAQGGTGKRVVTAAGCERANDVAACLRGKSFSEIVSSLPGTFGVFPRIYGPNVDGHVFPDQPLKIIARRDYPAVPIIIGSTAHETIRFVNAAGRVTDSASYTVAIEKVFGSAARDRILTMYPLSNYTTPRAAFVQLTTDAQFTCQSMRVARVLFGVQEQPIYRYIFVHSLENDPELKALRANHTIEHVFFFPWQGRYRPSAADLAVQQRMIGYWTRFAHTGNPNGSSDPHWPPHTPDNNAYLEIGSTTIAKRGPQSANCGFWDTVQLPWPHL